jgi:hypothetical protein
MNSNKRKATEQEVEEFNAKWQSFVLRTVYTKADLERMVAILDSPRREQSPAPPTSSASL